MLLFINKSDINYIRKEFPRSTQSILFGLNNRCYNLYLHQGYNLFASMSAMTFLSKWISSRILMYFATQVKSVNLTFSSGRFYKSSGSRRFIIFHFPIFATSTPTMTLSKYEKNVFLFIKRTLSSSQSEVHN